jgi:hypothetical protein
MPYSPAKPLPGAPRSAWVATVHIFGIFFFLFFFSLFSSARRGGSGTLKVRTLKGMLSYVCSFAAWTLAGDQNQENGHRQFSQIYRIQ